MVLFSPSELAQITSLSVLLLNQCPSRALWIDIHSSWQYSLSKPFCCHRITLEYLTKWSQVVSFGSRTVNSFREASFSSRLVVFLFLCRDQPARLSINCSDVIEVIRFSNSILGYLRDTLMWSLDQATHIILGYHRLEKLLKVISSSITLSRGISSIVFTISFTITGFERAQAQSVLAKTQ